MKKLLDGKYLDEEYEDKKTKSLSELDDYWDIEDRLYEQYKEMKIEGLLDGASKVRQNEDR